MESLLVSARSQIFTGRYSDALRLSKKISRNYESISDTENVITCLTDLGEIFFKQGLTEKAHALDSLGAIR